MGPGLACVGGRHGMQGATAHAHACTPPHLHVHARTACTARARTLPCCSCSPPVLQSMLDPVLVVLLLFAHARCCPATRCTSATLRSSWTSTGRATRCAGGAARTARRAHLRTRGPPGARWAMRAPGLQCAWPWLQHARWLQRAASGALTRGPHARPRVCACRAGHHHRVQVGGPAGRCQAGRREGGWAGCLRPCLVWLPPPPPHARSWAAARLPLAPMKQPAAIQCEFS